MNFVNRKSPVVSTAENALRRMISYTVAVAFVFFISLGFQIWASGLSGFLSLWQLLVAISVSGFIVTLSFLLKKKTPIAIGYLQPLTYAILASLIMPRIAPLYVIALCMVLIHFFTWVFRRFFKKNIVHPVLISVMIIQIIFRELLAIFETMGTIFQEEALGFGGIVLPFGFLSGLTIGGIAFIVLAGFWIYLSVTKILDLKMSIWYAIHVLWILLIMALFTEYTFWNLFNTLFLGYTVFTWVFFISEPTATPETEEMMIVYPAIAAFLMVWLKLSFNLTEAALYAIIAAQFFTWVLEQFQQRSTPQRIRLAYVSVFTIWVVMLIVVIIR